MTKVKITNSNCDNDEDAPGDLQSWVLVTVGEPWHRSWHPTGCVCNRWCQPCVLVYSPTWSSNHRRLPSPVYTPTVLACSPPSLKLSWIECEQMSAVSSWQRRATCAEGPKWLPPRLDIYNVVFLFLKAYVPLLGGTFFWCFSDNLHTEDL